MSPVDVPVDKVCVSSYMKLPMCSSISLEKEHGGGSTSLEMWERSTEELSEKTSFGNHLKII